MKKNLSVDAKNQGLTAAAQLADSVAVKAFLRAGSDPNSLVGELPPLHWAASNGCLESVKYLVDAGANVNAESADGLTARAVVEGSQRNQIVTLLSNSTTPAVEVPGLLIAEEKKRFDAKKARGVLPFQQDCGDGEFTIGFLEADIARVAKAFAKRHSKFEWLEDVADREVPSIRGAELQHLLQLTNSPWTILIRSIGHTGPAEFEEVPADVSYLSKTLKCRGVTYLAEDTACTVSYEIFERGKSTEQSCRGDALEFTSQRRDAPPRGLQKNFPDPVFVPLGIYLPRCDIDEVGSLSQLVMSDINRQAVERVDAFICPGR